MVNKAGKVLSFGELLIRLCPDAAGNWLNDNALICYTGGAELNVAKALALWGVDIKYFTALPDNALSAQIMANLGALGIDTSSVCYNGSRIGLYFLTPGQELKHDALIYDRAGSSFAGLQTGMIDWDYVLRDVSWFHFSAICPAISQNVADVCLEALQAASAKGIITSIDLNHRSKLWQYGKQPLQVIPRLAEFCDIVMGNLWSAALMLGISLSADIHTTGDYSGEAAISSANIIRQFPRCKLVANTFRFDNGDGIRYYSCLYRDKELLESKKYSTAQVIDKAGSGDCFMAGLIYGFKTGMALQETLEFATAAAFGKLMIEGDSTTQTVTAIKEMLR